MGEGKSQQSCWSLSSPGGERMLRSSLGEKTEPFDTSVFLFFNKSILLVKESKQMSSEESHAHIIIFLSLAQKRIFLCSVIAVHFPYCP